MPDDTLTAYWTWCLTPLIVPEVEYEDRLEVGEMIWADYERLGLLSPTSAAKEVMCMECDCGHVVEVQSKTTQTGKLTLFGVCPECGLFEIPPDRCGRWTVDFMPILNTLQTALGATGLNKSVVPGRVWDLGRAPVAGQSRTLWVGRGLDWDDACEVAKGIPRSRTTIVFVMGRSQNDILTGIPSESVISLDGIVSLRDGSLHVDVEAVDHQIKAVAPIVKVVRVKKRASRATAIDAVKNLLRDHIRSAKRHALDAQDRGREPQLLPPPTQREISKRLKLTETTVSRAINDGSDKEMKYLLAITQDIDRILDYQK